MPLTDAELLARLEELEARRINLGLYAARTTVADLREELGPAAAGAAAAELEARLRRLVDRGEVIEWRPGCFRSRVAETVRLLRLVRRRFWGQEHTHSPLLVEAVRVEFRQRRRPDRGAVPFADALPGDLPAPVAAAFRAAVAFPSVSRFQADAFAAVYGCGRRRNPDNDAFVIAGDTGAGKTEAFLFPILMDVLGEPDAERRLPGVRAVLVYPRIRLARNQLGRLLRYTGRLRAAGGPALTVAMQNAELPRDADHLAERWPARRRGGKLEHPVGLLETCVECGAGRYWVEGSAADLERGPAVLACEACGHRIDTLFLTQEALRNACPDLLIITDVSLHQWLARPHYSHLWGLWEGATVTAAPRYLVLDEIHLYDQIKGAHIARLIKRFQARVRLVARARKEPNAWPVVLGVSATLHDERRFLARLLDVPRTDPRYEARLHVIKPAREDLEPTRGRERYLFLYPRGRSPTPNNPEYRVDDQSAAIQAVMALMHNLKPADAVTAAWRGVAFFDSLNDLRQFRHNYDGELRDGQGEPPPANQAELWRIRTDRQARVGPRACSVPGRCGGTCEERAGRRTLHECPHFQAGDCWVFARLHGCNRRLEVADSVYAGTAAALDGRDLIPTSPALEVGYDDDAIQLVYQHKAPRSAASFIQRRGRAGRDPDDSPTVATLLWPHRPGDAFYFYRPEALYDPAFDDAPLNAGNFQVQRTHALLAFFDLLACLHRQNTGGVADDPGIPDFTRAGSALVPLGEAVASYRWMNDPKRPGQRRVVISPRRRGQAVWFSGKPVEEGWVLEESGRLRLHGWLALRNDLARGVLAAAWKHLSERDLFARYLQSAGVVTPAYQAHPSYPFRVPPGEVVSQVVRAFGRRDMHTLDKGDEGNWLQSFTLIDWMLQAGDEVTTLTIHYPDPADGPEQSVPVTFGLTELLPGNVSYRLRHGDAIHWTPVPAEGESTFLYPRESTLDEEGRPAGPGTGDAYLPELTDLGARADSIFGVPRFLDAAFPGLPLMVPRRLRAEQFGPPEGQYSGEWFFDPQAGRAVRVPAGQAPPPGALEVSRRSSTQAASVIVPHVVANRRVSQRALGPPLDLLFGSIDGYLEEGAALLGYTRVFHEMTVNLKVREPGGKAVSLPPLWRRFYPPRPRTDERGRPLPVLAGYSVQTHGIAFQLNPDLLARTALAVLADEPLRLHLRCRAALYAAAPYAQRAGLYPPSFLDAAEVALHYWLHVVVPSCGGAPRLLDPEADRAPLADYHRRHRNVRAAEAEEFEAGLDEGFFQAVNAPIEGSFRDTPAFRDFVTSVVLHSLATLLKRLIGRLGGVGAEALVAYADLPLLEKVDRAAAPRILIMDTVEGGSGGVAQAFERLDLTANEGSLWWMLQTELGHCPIQSGEELVREFLGRASVGQVRAVQQQASPEALARLVEDLGLAPLPEAVPALGRVLFAGTEVAGQSLNPALILKELFAAAEALNARVPLGYPREAVVCRAVAALDPAAQPNLAALREALGREGSAGEPEHELALQLLALFEQACPDGCPVCLGAGSDVEHYHLAGLLGSRRVLHKLREVLLAPLPKGSCLADLADALLDSEPVEVGAPPGGLGNRLDAPGGLAVVTQSDGVGQVRGASATVVRPGEAEAFFRQPDSWTARWGGPEHRTVRTLDGGWVRSRAEALIADWLWAQKIPYVYEQPLPYVDGEGRTRQIHPDFFLFEGGVYVEYWGRDDTEYLESRRYKESAYARRGIAPVHVEKDEVDSGAFQAKILARLRPG
jgi:hypothetical protein